MKCVSLRYNSYLKLNRIILIKSKICKNTKKMLKNTLRKKSILFFINNKVNFDFSYIIISYSNVFHSFKNIIKYSTNSYSVIKGFYGLKKSDIIYKISYFTVPNISLFAYFNNIFLNCIVSNVTINNSFKVCTSNGTYTKIRSIDRVKKIILITFPSGCLKRVAYDFTAYFGRNCNIFHKFIVEGKSNKFSKNTPSVRGVAMNPIDHPNGGRTKTCQPEKSIWGWVAKYTK